MSCLRLGCVTGVRAGDAARRARFDDGGALTGVSLTSSSSSSSLLLLSTVLFTLFLLLLLFDCRVDLLLDVCALLDLALLPLDCFFKDLELLFLSAGVLDKRLSKLS